MCKIIASAILQKRGYDIRFRSKGYERGHVSPLYFISCYFNSIILDYNVGKSRWFINRGVAFCNSFYARLYAK